MRTRIIKIRLSRLASEAADYVDQVPALVPGDGSSPVIVERAGESTYIVDGFHRIAGMLRWCRENDRRPNRTLVAVVVSASPNLTRYAAEPGLRQRRAIGRIYALAGVQV